MNLLDFNQSVGFPLETNILDQMQKAWRILNALGGIAGNFAILEGCTVQGTTVSGGVVFINGEVIEFKGGQAQENVIIVEKREAQEFEDGNANDVIYTRYATFGVATTQWAWTNFKRVFESINIPAALEEKEDKTTVTALLKRVTDLEKRSSNIPIGMIALWDRPADEIPEGWAEYVDLRGRMPIGYNADDPDFDQLRGYGGAKTKQLDVTEIPPHTHNIPLGSQKVGTGNSNSFGYGEGKDAKTANDGGGGKPFSIMNPHRIVHFIKYTG